MGAVYLASDERFGSTVAIKETLLADENFIKAFKREARLLNSLKHSALPKVTDHFIEGAGQFIVMEYIPGDDLFEMLEKKKEAFPLADVTDWAGQLLDALEYLHNQENPVIHRDIKPQNLKLTSSGKIILLDFGLAKGNPTDANHQTAANSIFGYSRNYASLEQIQGTGTDPRSDFYSLAATLYHLVTGKPPADALTRVMMVMNEDADPLIPAHQAHERVTAQFSAFLSNALSLNANQRPQKVSEMRRMLHDENLTAVSTKPRTVSTAPVSAEFLDQNTKIISEPKKSELKTEILSGENPSGASVQTKLSDPQTLPGDGRNTKENQRIAPPPGIFEGTRRKIYAAASALGVLALVSGIFAMILMSDSGAASSESKNAVDAGNSATKKIATSPENTAGQKSGDPNRNSEIAVEQKSNDQALDQSKADSASSSGENLKPAGKIVSKPIKNAGGSASAARDEDADADEVVFRDGKMITKDGTVITDDGRIIFKDGTVIDEKGISKDGKLIPSGKTVVVTPKSSNNPPIPPEEYKKLTPAQKEKVRQAVEMRARELLRRRQQQNRRPRTRSQSPPPPNPPTLD